MTQITHLKADEILTKVPNEYANFANVFSSKLVVELPKHTRINNRSIELVDGWQSPYGLIYTLGPVELEILKVYIKNNLANGFIRPSQSPTWVFISFDKKSDRSLSVKSGSTYIKRR